MSEAHLVPYYTPDVGARGNWRHVPCTDPAVNDAAKPAAWRWQGAYAEDAWEDVREGYRRNKTNPSYRLSFPRSVSNFFHGPEAMDCDALAPSNGCHGGNYLTCGDIQSEGAPAAYFILNSFMKIESVSILLNLTEKITLPLAFCIS